MQKPLVLNKMNGVTLGPRGEGPDSEGETGGQGQVPGGAGQNQNGKHHHHPLLHFFIKALVICSVECAMSV